jgi:hypothetical protein
VIEKKLRDEGIHIPLMEISHVIGKEKNSRPELRDWSPFYESKIIGFIQSGILTRRGLIAAVLENQLCGTPEEACAQIDTLITKKVISERIGKPDSYIVIE